MENPTESQFGNAAPVFLNPRLDPEHAAKEVRLYDLAVVLRDLTSLITSTYLLNDRLMQQLLNGDANDAHNLLVRFVAEEQASAGRRRFYHRKGIRRVNSLAKGYRDVFWRDACFPWKPDHSLRRRLVDADFRSAEDYLHWFSQVREHLSDVCHDLALLTGSDLARQPVKYERVVFCQLALVVCGQVIDLLDELRMS